ncbi:MAG: Lipid export ATP-binding/permease protein MsbA, partial [Chloroflexi bacterium]|nr:Lipid export ATP-binding/permease protein MsbA [Chloroflexota bacterium]
MPERRGDPTTSRTQATGGEPGGDSGPQPASKALRRALGYLRVYWRSAGGALLALILVSALNLATPQFIRIAIDQGVTRQQRNAIVIAVVGLVATALLRGFFSFLQGYLAEVASQGVAYDLRNSLFAKLQRLSFSYYDRVATGQLITRVTNDVEQIRTFAGTGIVQIVAAVVMLVGTTVVLFLLNWRLALVSLIPIPAIVVLLAWFVRQIGPLFGRVQGMLDQLNTILREDLAGLRTIRAFGREKYETARYHATNEQLLDANLTTVRAVSINFPLVFLFANLGTLAVIWFGGLQVIGGSLSVGELVAFNTYLGFLLFPILTIGFQAAGISRAGASAVRVYEIIDTPIDVQERPDAVVLPPIEHSVEMRGVHFRYPGSDREILSEISFRAEPGQTIAIMGSTGSGKSALVHLLPRFYDVSSGSVTFDGHDVRDVALASLRSQIGIVLQETLLFSGTLRDNIAYWKPDAKQEQVEA